VTCKKCTSLLARGKVEDPKAEAEVRQLVEQEQAAG